MIAHSFRPVALAGLLAVMAHVVAFAVALS